MGKINEFLQKMMTAHQLDLGEGRTELLGFRMAFMPTNTLCNLIRHIYERDGEEVFDMLFDVGVEHGKYAIDVLGRAHDVPRKQFIDQFGSSANVLGMGKWEFKQIDINGGKIVLELSDSPYVEELKNDQDIVDCGRNVDALQRGMLHGIVEELVDYPIESEEVHCAIHGNQVCQIVIRPTKN